MIDIEAFEIYRSDVDARPSQPPIGVLLTQTAKTLSRSFDAALAEHGGSLATWLVLLSLTGAEHGSQRSIAAGIGIEGPTLTHHLNRMQADGLVTRVRDPRNRRAHLVALTVDGRATFHSLLGAVVGFDERLRAGFSDDELATLRDLLHRPRQTPRRHPNQQRRRSDDHRRQRQAEHRRDAAQLHGPPARRPTMTAATQRRPGYRPSRLQRSANTMLSRALRNGRGPRFMRLLTVRGRRSGAARSTPVVPVRDGERTWVVSPFGEVGWVRDARVAGQIGLDRGGDHTTYEVRELGPDESLPVLERYRSTPARSSLDASCATRLGRIRCSNSPRSETKTSGQPRVET